MPLIPLRFTPGINKEITSHSNEGGWIDCDKIRFRQGFPESIGGWDRASEQTFQGICRGLYTWADLNVNIYTGLGTNLKYYILTGGGISDITPIRATTAAGDVTFSATNGSDQLTVTDTDHGALANDFVTFSGAVTLGGNVTADILNAEHQIDTIVDVDTYMITLSVTADGSDTGNGGASVVGEYQINTGGESQISGSGWGTGAWGLGGWGTASSSAITTTNLRTWSADNFGEDLIFNPRFGGIYYWDTSNGVSQRAFALSDLSGAESTPTLATHILVSDQDRHVIAFGCDDEFDAGTVDPLLIRFSDQENAADWRTLTTNTAGSLRVSSGSRIITALQTKREIVVFTDASVHTMQFLGPPFTFGLQEVAPNSGVVGPNAAINANDIVYWMADGRFMVYDGRVRELPCDVKSFVFDNINLEQMEKVYGGHLAEYEEIWWFYPTGTECDRYVVYNYVQDIWYVGSFDRTAFERSGILRNPLATGTDGYVYTHENGINDDSGINPAGIQSYIESAQINIGDGDNFMFASRIIPDLDFRSSTNSSGSVTLTMKARDFPGFAYGQTDDQSVDITPAGYTGQVFVRLRGRAMSVRLDCTDQSVEWRLGIPRVQARADGRR